MTKFWELLEKSVIVQAITTSALVLVCCYLWMNAQVVPDDLQKLTLLVIGYYFGSKTQQAAYKATQG